MKQYYKVFLSAMCFTLAAAHGTHAQTTIQVGLDDPSAKPLMGYIPSPQTWAFMKYADESEANRVQGTASARIPIYTYQDDDFTIPVSLDYASNGLIPSMQTGIVGLGWFLNAGGMITREIRGVPDEFLPDNQTRIVGDQTSHIVAGFLNGGAYDDMQMMNLALLSGDPGIVEGSETEADQFHFKFTGHSGSFSMDSSRKLKVHNASIGYGTYRIDLNVQKKSISEITITTEEGYVYTFGGSEEYVERSVEGNYRVLGGSIYFLSFGAGECPVVSWYLREIKSPGGRKVTFGYTDGAMPSSMMLMNDNQCTNLAVAFSQGYNTIPEGNLRYNFYKWPSVVKTTYLSRISVEGGAGIFFDYSPKECTEISLSAVGFYCPTVQKMRKLDCIRVWLNSQNQLSYPLSYKTVNQRLLLDKVRVPGQGEYKMEYCLNHPLPDIATNNVDFWGYYNGMTSLKDSVLNPMAIDNTMDERIARSFKNPNAEYSQLGCLLSITYPMTGIRSFQYEAHTAEWGVFRRRVPSVYSDYKRAFCPMLHPYSTLFANPECGGVRVKEVREWDSSRGPGATTKYSYVADNGSSSGIMLDFPRFYVNKYQGEYIRKLGMQLAEHTFRQPHIEYEAVQEVYSDGSQVRSRFTSYRTHPDDYKMQTVAQIPNVLWISECDTAFLKNISRQPNSCLYQRGRPTEVTGYDQSGQKVSRTQYAYGKQDAKGGNDFSASMHMSNGWFSSRASYLSNFMLTHKTEKRYFGTDSLATQELYLYGEYGLLDKTDRTEADGTVRAKWTTYDRPILSDGCLPGYALPDKVFYLFKRVDDEKECAVGVEKYTYHSVANKGLKLLKSVQKAALDAPVMESSTVLFQNMTFDFLPAQSTVTCYNDYRQVVEQVIGLKEDGTGVPVCYIRGYQGTYVVAQVRNAGLSAIKAIPGLEGIDHTPLSQTLTPAQEQALRALRNAEVITYEYKPCVGPSRVSDASGRTISYEYDAAGRLYRVRDAQGNLLKEYTYSNN